MTPSSLDFNGTGSNIDQSTTVSETGGYTGTFTATTSNCSGIAEITSPTTVGQNGTYTVQPDGPGSCQYTVRDQNGMTATLSITVTTTSVVVNGTKRGTPSKTPATPAATPMPQPAPAPTIAPAPATQTQPRANPVLPRPHTQSR